LLPPAAPSSSLNHFHSHAVTPLLLSSPLPSALLLLLLLLLLLAVLFPLASSSLDVLLPSHPSSMSRQRICAS
jgi:hypothetical protein